MKSIKLILLLLAGVVLFWACAEEYEEPTGNVFQGVYSWRYTDTLDKVTKKYARITPTSYSQFVDVKSENFEVYIQSKIDSTRSFRYAFDEAHLEDIYGVNLIKMDTIPVNEFSKNVDYYFTYSFVGDTMFLKKYPITRLQNGHIKVEHSLPALSKMAFVRPK